MISDQLKNAWRQYQMENTLHPITPDEVLTILEQREAAAFRTARMLLDVGTGLLLIMCCQGG